MKNKVKSVMSRHKDKKIILSVSGGVDSLVLLDVFLKLKYSLVVVHFNHQQREQSAIEANYIKEFCEKNNLLYEYYLLTIKKGKNFQAEASKLRRKYLIKTAKKHDSNVVVTAHHLNDLAETILLKLSRGSNLLGYAGMQESYYKNGNYFLKPLLKVSKDEVLKYAKTNNITFFEDKTNLSLVYARNKIRHQVIPYLIADNKSFLSKIIEYNEILSKSFKFIRKNTIDFLNHNNKFNINAFIKLDEVIQDDIVAYLLEENDLELSKEKIAMIVNFLTSSGPNATLDIGNNLLFKKSYNFAYIDKESKQISFKQKLSLTKTNYLKNGDVIIFNNDFAETLNNSVIICYNKMALPLYARTRKPGDKLSFSYGHKKLKDFYIDEKIPLNERNEDVLIVDNNGLILAVLGKYVNKDSNLKEKIKLLYRRK